MPIFGKRTRPRGNPPPKIPGLSTPVTGHPYVDPKVFMPPVKPPKARERVYCKDCSYWDRILDHKPAGRCRIGPPCRDVKVGEGEYMGGWRRTIEDDWCGAGEKKAPPPPTEDKEDGPCPSKS